MATAPRKKKAPIPAPTEQHIALAAKTPEISKLVRLARVFTRVGARGPFSVDIPLFCSMFMGEKGYRKGNVPVDTRLQTLEVLVGKRAGLIFRFKPVGQLLREGEPVEAVEMGWEDIVGTMPELCVQLATFLDDTYVAELDKGIKAVIAKNPAMHGVIAGGFSKAQSEEKEDVSQEELEANENWGQF